MSQELVIHKQSRPLRPKLQKLAAAAMRAHLRARDCAAKAVENMVRAGQSLRKLRDLCNDDEWNDFLLNEFDGSERTVQRYMHLAKHWSLLKAMAPPEALTSQRKALQILSTLLYGEGATAGAAPGPRKRRAKAAVIELSPASTNVDTGSPAQRLAPEPADDQRRVAVQQMYDDLLRVLADLSKDLSELSPPHYLVRHALAAIGRAQRQCVESGQKLFHPDAASGEDCQRGCDDSGGQTASFSEVAALVHLDHDS